MKMKSNITITENPKRHRRTEWNQNITQSNTQTSEMEHATAWETGENEYDVRVPARYREYTCAYRVHAIHRECGEITHYVYRVTAKQLAELNKIIELIKKFVD